MRGGGPPGPDQPVPNLPREPEVGMAVVVDVPDLSAAEPVAGYADSTWTVFVPLSRTLGEPNTSRSIEVNSS